MHERVLSYVTSVYPLNKRTFERRRQLAPVQKQLFTVDRDRLTCIVTYSYYLIPITNKQCQLEETLLKVCRHLTM